MFQPTAIPAPLDGVLGAARSLCSDETRDSLIASGPEARAAWLSGLQQLADAVSAATVTATEVFDSHGDAETLHGASSTQSWLRGALRLTSGEASTRVQVARASRGVLAPALEKLRDGELTFTHVRTIDRGVRLVPDDRQGEAAHVLTELAVAASVNDVRTAAQHLQHVVDPDGSLAECERQFERRYLSLAPLLDGMTAVDGLLDAESAALLTGALEPFLTPTDSVDRRSAAQRRADGLMQIVQGAADHRLIPVAGGERPHLQVVVDPRATDPVRPTDRAGVHPASGVLPQTPGGPSTLHPVSVTRVACDCQLTALLLDDHGVVVDLGRSQRLFSAQQRRLLAARDGGCRWPGCVRPPAHTDAHHAVSWLDGGLTDVTNGVLLCRYHHRNLHEGGWRLVVVDAGRGTGGAVIFVGPEGQRLTSDPRGP